MDTTLSHNLQISTTDHVLILLNSLPQEAYYKTIHGKKPVVYYPDSLHILIDGSSKGRYQLNIKATPEAFSSQQENLVINVEKPSLLSFRFLHALGLYILLLFSASIIAISFINFRNKEKLFELRNDWTNQLHNDIGGDLSSVSKRLEILQRKLSQVDEKVFDNLNKTFLILMDIQKKLRFVFNLVDPKKNTLQVMFAGLYDFALDNCNFQGINFAYKNNISENELYNVDVGRINKIYLVLKEGLNNAFKSSKAKNIVLSIASHKEGIWVELKDDGVGFDPSAQYSGNGLNNIRQDAKDGFMDIEIRSEIGVGTQISMLVFAARKKV